MKAALIFTLAVLGGYLHQSSVQSESADQNVLTELFACFYNYTNDQVCPDWDKAKTCMQLVQTTNPTYTRYKDANIKHVEDQKKKECGYLTKQNTCLKELISQCFDKYLEFLKTDDPKICLEAKKTLKCAHILENECGNSYLGTEYVKEITRLCNAGYYQGACNPRVLRACVEPAFGDDPNFGVFDIRPICKRSSAETAMVCLQTVKPSCTADQEENYNTEVYVLENCLENLRSRRG